MSLYSGLNLGKAKAPPTTHSSSDKKQAPPETSTPPVKGAVFYARTARRKPNPQAPWGSKPQPLSASPKSRDSTSSLDTPTHKPNTSSADTLETVTPSRLPFKPYKPLSSWQSNTEPDDQVYSSTIKADVPFLVPPKFKASNKGNRTNPLAGLNQEYNPLAPNHYDQCIAALKQQQHDELIRKETKQQRRLQQKLASRQDAGSTASLKSRNLGDEPCDAAGSTTSPLLPSFLPSNHANPLAPQSTVVLLCNMVGPGEVDDELQEETMEECRRYGPVLLCKVLEVTDGSVPSEKAVRIFVQFATADAAERALQDLDGRYFGGRMVTATYFDPDRFARGELGP